MQINFTPHFRSDQKLGEFSGLWWQLFLRQTETQAKACWWVWGTEKSWNNYWSKARSLSDFSIIDISSVSKISFDNLSKDANRWRNPLVLEWCVQREYPKIQFVQLFVTRSSLVSVWEARFALVQRCSKDQWWFLLDAVGRERCQIVLCQAWMRYSVIIFSREYTDN